MGVWIYFGLSHAIIGSNPSSIYTHYTGHLSPCYWIYVIYVSTPQYNSINGAFFTINHFSFHTKSKTHAKIYWTQKVLKYQCNVCLYSVWLMYYVSPTALQCAAFDHSINPFSLSLCPICNTVYTLYWQLNQICLFIVFFGSHCWSICTTFTPLTPILLFEQFSGGVSPVSCFYGNIYLSVLVYIGNVLLCFK